MDYLSLILDWLLIICSLLFKVYVLKIKPSTLFKLNILFRIYIPRIIDTSYSGFYVWSKNR